MKKLIIAISILALFGSLAWAGKVGNQFNSNPIVIRSAGSGATVQLDSPRFITNIVWHIDSTSVSTSLYTDVNFVLEDGRFNEILKDRNIWDVHKPTVYSLDVPVQGIHCASITAGTELFIYVR